MITAVGGEMDGTFLTVRRVLKLTITADLIARLQLQIGIKAVGKLWTGCR